MVATYWARTDGFADIKPATALKSSRPVADLKPKAILAKLGDGLGIHAYPNVDATLRRTERRAFVSAHNATDRILELHELVK